MQVVSCFLLNALRFAIQKEFNLIAVLGGWGGRNEKSGPYVYFKKDSMIIDTTAGKGGSHAKRHEFDVRMRI